jgi:hypothetical protein
MSLLKDAKSLRFVASLKTGIGNEVIETAGAHIPVRAVQRYR